MTACDPPDGKPGSAQGAVFADGLGGVLGTTRGEAAPIAEKGTQQQLVSPDQPL